jgi:hypothetical protein
VPPPPSPPHHVVIIVVFVSLGGLLLLACLAALFCSCHKKKGRKAEVLNFSDHAHVHKDTVPGPEGGKAVKLTVDEDVKFQEAVEMKQDTTTGEPSHTTGAGGRHSSWHRHQKHHARGDKETELINVTGHKHVVEKIVPGPHGDEIEALSEDGDVRFEAAEGEPGKSRARMVKSKLRRRCHYLPELAYTDRIEGHSAPGNNQDSMFFLIYD